LNDELHYCCSGCGEQQLENRRATRCSFAESCSASDPAGGVLFSRGQALRHAARWPCCSGVLACGHGLFAACRLPWCAPRPPSCHLRYPPRASLFTPLLAHTGLGSAGLRAATRPPQCSDLSATRCVAREGSLMLTPPCRGVGPLGPSSLSDEAPSRSEFHRDLTLRQHSACRGLDPEIF